MAEKETCGAEFVPADSGDSTGPCVREDRPHVIHRHADGSRTIQTPAGALVAQPKTD